MEGREGGGMTDDNEEQVSFVDCTCDHEPEEHGWQGCNVDECKCQGHWEE